ncbi:MAG: type III PLP-dependent enzyme [Chloroflexi bacterium]|nr:type III PLP-dependent enzyme [Chloroflexota bacterium]MDL1883921.1 type III PLP-dependent enzyme [Anaerolineae bacterium CFX8]
MDVLMDSVLRDARTVTPSLVLDFKVIKEHYDGLLAAMPGASLFYAVKANASPQILALVVERGGGLEIASLAELERALDAGAPGSRIICSNPIKNPAFLERMHHEGVYAMTADSTYELEKIARHAPGSRVYVRLAVDNRGSVLPLAGKFGVDAEEALALFDLARELGLDPIGLSFHVGSQCLSANSWANAIRTCGEVWRAAAGRGHRLNFLDIGGGFPAGHYHTPSIPTVNEIGAAVMDAVRRYIPREDLDILALEPGRGLVGEAGRLLVSVVGKARRGGDEWLYLDAGVFNGLMETYEGFPPVVRLLADDAGERPVRSYTLAGPSCDSCDVVARGVELPEVHIGDRLVFLDAGAYTNEYAAAFNGFPIPRWVALNVEAERLVE